MIDDPEFISDMALADVEELLEKQKSYGDSWKSRGGVGAFMMLARKWDRIENQVGEYDYNVFTALEGLYSGGVDGLLDDIQDLRRYLLLVEYHAHKAIPPYCHNTPGWLIKKVAEQKSEPNPATEGEPTRNYTNQK